MQVVTFKSYLFCHSQSSTDRRLAAPQPPLPARGRLRLRQGEWRGPRKGRCPGWQWAPTEPQGMIKNCQATPTGARVSALLPGGVLRPAIALSVLGLLAACGGQQPAGTHGVARAGAQHWNRPTSYDPPGPPSDPWGPWVHEASRRFDVPERWIREVMRQESGGRISATSP